MPKELKKPKSPEKKIEQPETHKKVAQTTKDLLKKIEAQSTDSNNE